MWASLVCSVSKESAWNAGDWGSIPGLGGSPGEGNGNPIPYSCLEKSVNESGGRQSMGSQRVRHDAVTKPPQHISKYLLCACHWAS